MHKPVLVQEVLAFLDLKPGEIVIDGTLGNAGHTIEILKKVGAEGRVIALDRDPAAIERCGKILEPFPQASMHLENFSQIETVLDSLNLQTVDAVLLDVGFSQNQIEDSLRGFSFEREGDLDMRMGPDAPWTAKEIVNNMGESEIETIFRNYGEERRARFFAKAICREREGQAIETTTDLIRVLETALPFKIRKSGGRPAHARRHFATRVFQALRIAVNGELENLTNALPAIWKRLAPQGRLAVISFHSLEDRIIKRQFRAWSDSGEGRLVTKKPVTATFEERSVNPRSRSAKLRGIEKK